MIEELQKKAINTIFEQRERFIIIGLTGKIGSGCSTVAKQCEKSFRELKLSCPQPVIENEWCNESRDSRILQRFYAQHIKNKEFYIIKVRDVILSFILEDKDTLERFKKEVKITKPKSDVEEIILKALNEAIKMEDTPEELKEYWDNLERDSQIERLFELNKLAVSRQKDNYIPRYYYIYKILPYIGKKIHTSIKEIYTKIFQNYGNELRFFGTLKVKEWEQKFSEQQFFDMNFYTVSERINYFIKALEHRRGEDKAVTFVVIDSMKNMYESLYLKDRYSSYYLISVSKEEKLRKENIRQNKPYYSEEDIQYLDYNERPNEARKKFDKFLKMVRGKIKKDRIRTEINHILNEEYIDFFKSYALHIREDEEEKKVELEWSEEFQNEGITEELFKYYLHVLQDPLRVFIYHAKLQQIYLQDVESCIQNADIFLANNETSEEPHKLNLSLIRYISLMMHPGLVTPTEVEKCMQIAYAAKVNSGCISRQVGAVVTDSQYNILSLGWNDVPCGQVSCNRRNLFDLARALDPKAYSDYENGPRTAFRNEINKYKLDKLSPESILNILNGLPAAFCFKDIQEKVTGDKNPMDARSMHGEEKALLACDQQRVRGGYLFTTSSPCEMCAKNAKDHRISKIYYIEPYPGISQSHVCNSGEEKNRAQYVLFEGAIGRAYTQLYTSVMPYKDELKLRGIEELKKGKN